MLRCHETLWTTSNYPKVSKVLHLNVEVLEILDAPGTRVEMTDKKKNLCLRVTVKSLNMSFSMFC